MRSLCFTAFVLGSALTACSPYDPDLGASPFKCGPSDQEKRCPDGYECMAAGMNGEEVCLAPMGTVPDGGGNANCADDSQLEPNESYMQAFQTPVATQKNTLTFAGLAICPSGDKDTYGLTIPTMGQNVEVIIEFEAAGATLQGSILNAGGTPIANATAATGQTGTIRAMVPNLNPGTYYVQVFGPASGTVTTNNYKLTVNVTGP
jgi:hypothetical protein